MSVQTYIGTLVVETCYKCGMPFGLDADFRRRKLETGTGFFCPQGHGQVFITSEVQRLKQELAAANERKDYLHRAKDRLHEELLQQKYKTRAEKAAKTRVLNRVHAGVCTCCNRTFQNLRRHMETKHPKEIV